MGHHRKRSGLSHAEVFGRGVEPVAQRVIGEIE
jgi:hypothetical protein